MSNRVISKDELEALERWQPEAASDNLEEIGSRGGGPLTAEQIEKIQEQAYKEAYEEGLRKGFDQGFKNGSAKVDEAVKVFQKVIETLSKPMDKLNQDFEQQLGVLLKQIAQQLIRREFTLDPSLINDVIKECLRALPVSNQQIKIFLHPEDAAVARSVLLPNDKSEQWEIIEQADMQRGDCNLATQDSFVDASLCNKLDTLMAGMLDQEGEQA